MSAQDVVQKVEGANVVSAAPCKGEIPLALILTPEFEGVEGWRKSIFEKQSLFTTAKITHLDRGRVITGASGPYRSCLALINSPELKPFKTIQEYIAERAVIDFPRLGMKPFDWQHVQTSVVSYGEGDRFDPHYDDLDSGPMIRMVTFVYFLHSEPRKFSGGELELFGTDGGSQMVLPEGGSLVLFRADTLHRVHPVQLATSCFEDRRLVISGFISRRRTRIERVSNRVLPVLKRIARRCWNRVRRVLNRFER